MLPWSYFKSRDSEEVHRRFHTLIRDLYHFIRYLFLGPSPEEQAVERNDDNVNVPDLVANIQDSALARRPERDRDESLS